MRRFAHWCLALAFFTLHCAAQDLVPRSYGSGEIRGRIVDSAGTPVAGVIVVARWNWMRYISKLENSGYSLTGDVVHIAEAVTDRDGRYTIPAWGPVIRAGGRVEENAPAILAYKEAFEPSAGRDPNVRLLARQGSAAEHALRVREFQERSLAWHFSGETWKSMPRMVDALRAAKAHEGKEGARILGTHTLPGRSGAGRVLDAAGARVTGGYVAAEWTLRRTDGTPGTSRIVHARRFGTNRFDVDFYVSPYRPLPEVPGWEVDPAIAPDVAIYAPGFRVQRVRAWTEAGRTIGIPRSEPGREGTLAEMREWRSDIDRAIGLGQGEAALQALFPLLFAFESRCRELTPDLRKGICHEAGTEVARFLARPRTHYLVFESFEGVEEFPVVAGPAGAAFSAASGGRTTYMSRVPVSGFSIEPVKR